MITFRGWRQDGRAWITVEGPGLRPCALPKRLDLRHHSEDFEWGYQGSGPAQSALAILSAVAGDSLAKAYYQTFKREVIAPIQADTWALTDADVRAWLHNRPKEELDILERVFRVEL